MFLLMRRGGNGLCNQAWQGILCGHISSRGFTNIDWEKANLAVFKDHKLFRGKGREPFCAQLEGHLMGSEQECLMTITDITELRLEEQKFHIVADNTSDWVFWMALEGAFVYNSPTCKKNTGYDPALFYDDPGLMLKIIFPDDQETFKHHSQVHAETGISDEVAVFERGRIGSRNCTRVPRQQ